MLCSKRCAHRSASSNWSAKLRLCAMVAVLVFSLTNPASFPQATSCRARLAHGFLGGRFHGWRVPLFVLPPKLLEQKQVHLVFLAVAGPLARNDVPQICDRKTVLDDGPLFGFAKAGDPVRRMDQVQVERASFKLHKISPVENFLPDEGGNLKADGIEGAEHPHCIMPIFRQEKVHILRNGRVAQQNRAAFADEQIFDPVGGTGGGDRYRLLGGKLTFRHEDWAPANSPDNAAASGTTAG